ncbi:MAG: CPBP family intramembrane glutamic endopeptidase [Algoriphagus sp.]
MNLITWQRVPKDELSFKDLNQESNALLGYSVFYILLAVGIGKLIQVAPFPILGAADFIQDLWYALVFKLIFLLFIPSYLYFNVWNYSKKDLVLGLRATPTIWFKGILLVLVGFGLNAGHIPGILAQAPLVELAGLKWGIGIVLPLLIAGLPEELFFRGMLQTRLEKRWNTAVAILVSGILFTAWHLPSRFFLASGVEGQAGDLSSVVLGTGVPVLLVSLYFGWHWARYRNLPLLICAHWAIDILPSLSSFFGISN